MDYNQYYSSYSAYSDYYSPAGAAVAPADKAYHLKVGTLHGTWPGEYRGNGRAFEHEVEFGTGLNKPRLVSILRQGQLPNI